MGDFKPIETQEQLDSIIGERIKEIRINDMNMNQSEFASKIGITRQYLSLLERNERTPSELVINAISREFGILREWIIAGEEPKFDPLTPALTEVLTPHPETLRLMRIVAPHMTEASWKALNELLGEIIRGNR